MPAGPMLRGFQFLNWSSETFCAGRESAHTERVSAVSNNLIKGMFCGLKLKEKRAHPQPLKGSIHAQGQFVSGEWSVVSRVV
jgi:hypothetical protein